MTLPIVDESPLDLAQQGEFEEERRSVVQPSPAEDESVLQHQAVELTPSPRCRSDEREVLQQPWSDDESSHWRRAPR
jgi:hypothetical protein